MFSSLVRLSLAKVCGYPAKPFRSRFVVTLAKPCRSWFVVILAKPFRLGSWSPSQNHFALGLWSTSQPFTQAHGPSSHVAFGFMVPLVPWCIQVSGLPHKTSRTCQVGQPTSLASSPPFQLLLPAAALWRK